MLRILLDAILIVFLFLDPRLSSAADRPVALCEPVTIPDPLYQNNMNFDPRFARTGLQYYRRFLQITPQGPDSRDVRERLNRLGS
jgi:hypothetical protein